MRAFPILLLALFLLPYQIAASADENQVKRLLVLYTPTDGTNIDWNADGSLILTGAGSTAHLWNAETGEEIYNVNHGGHLFGLSMNDSGDRFLTWSGETIHTWDTATGRLLGTQSSGSVYGFQGAMWHGADVIYILGGTIVRWDGLSPDNQHGFLVPGENFNSYPSGAALNRDATQFLTWNTGTDTVPMVRLWQISDDFEDAAPVLAFEHGGRRTDEWIDGAAWSPDETMIVSWSQSWVKVWDAHDGTLLQTLNDDSYLTSARWSPDSRYILVEDIGKNESRVWDAQSGEEVLTISGTDAMWDTTGKRLLTGRVHPALIVVPSGEPVAEFPDDMGIGYSIWHPDGIRFLVETIAGVQVWIIPPLDKCVLHALAPANLRAAARADSERVGTLPPHHLVTATSTENDAAGFVWWQVDYSAWVRADLVEATGYCAFPAG